MASEHDDIPEAPPPELDAEIEVAGEVYYFRRSIGLARRIEQRFGPVFPLAGRCERADVTMQQLSGLLEEMIRGAPDGPRRHDIERWLFEVGPVVPAKHVAKVLYELTIGNRNLRLAEEARRLAGEDTANPMRAAPQGAATR